MEYSSLVLIEKASELLTNVLNVEKQDQTIQHDLALLINHLSNLKDYLKSKQY